MIDSHTHTTMCKHAEGAPEEYLLAAEAAGLAGIGVADHFPWPAGYDEKHRMKPDEYPDYKRLVENLRRFGREKGLEVLYAAEADWVPGGMEEVFRVFDEEDFDYVIGSIHFVDDLPFDHPDHKAVWFPEGRPAFIWRRYYELMLDMVSSGRFDVIGHFDLPKKFGSRPPREADVEPLIDAVIEAASDLEVAVEINTSGLRKPVAELYPSFDILKKMASAGIILTLGSDAHSPGEVGADFAVALEAAKEAGFDSVHSFRGRKPRRVISL
jgi:histidinol-phosphatase (PHP family)